MFCKKCGKEVPYGMIICEKCAIGMTLDKPPKPVSTVSQSAHPIQTPPNTDPINLPNSISIGVTGSSSAPTTNNLALVSLIISIVGFIFLGGIVGMILGIIAINQIKSSGGKQKGNNLAIAAIVIGGIQIYFVLYSFVNSRFWMGM